jgi:hypothetical protein
LDVFGKELLLQLRSYEPANQQKKKGTCQYQPSVLNGPAYQAVVETIETALALFLDRQLFFFGGLWM